MNVPILDLKLQYQSIAAEVKSAVNRVLDEGIYILGDEVETLEKNLSRYCGAPYALGISCGTDALLLALLSIDIQPGDEVITTPYSFFASSETISFLKAKPVFVDIDPDTFCIDPSKIEAAITPKTKALLPVHIFGQCSDMDPILDIAKKHKLFVIEDGCQAIGAEYKGKKACSMGDLGALSFYPTKNLGAYGEGGMLFVKEEERFLRARRLRTHGEFPKTYQPRYIGMNARLETIQAAILNVKFKYLDEWNRKRREKAQTYYRLFEEAGLLRHIVLPKTAAENLHVFHLYVILTKHKKALQAHLKEEGIQTGNHYPIPLAFLDCYRDLHYQPGDLPVAEQICAESVALPIYPEITLEQQTQVVSKIKSFYRHK